MESLYLPKINAKMLTRTNNTELSKIVSNSEIHLHHCLCESRAFKVGKSNHRRCSLKKMFLKILQKWQKRPCVWVWHRFSHASSSRTFLSLYFFLLFFMRTVSASCSVSTCYKFFLWDILLSVWLIFNTIFLNWKLITLVLLRWAVILLAAFFDNIWNSMEYVINLDDIWRYLQKLLISELNDIRWYLTIIWRYLTTENFTLELENYHPKDIVNFVIYCLVGTKL